MPAELANHAQYEVLRELGRGGMGVVYLANNKLMDRLEVLKVINKTLLDRPGAVERFLREIRSAAKLTHANVVTAYSAVQQGTLLAFAMEYVDGSDLATVVKAQGPLPVPHACFYVQQAAWGLQHAFEKQMVHRDIKPQNLILARDGKKHIVKILDFGLAKATQAKKGENLALTRTGQMMGTPDYIAPEQSLDAASADIRADIYSLGCTLYFLLSGHAPFSGNSLAGILMAHQMDEAKPLNLVRPEVPEELAAVVRKMMAKDPAKRYQTPAEVAQVLGPFIKSGPAAAPGRSSPALSQATPPSPTMIAADTKTDPPIAAVVAPPPIAKKVTPPITKTVTPPAPDPAPLIAWGTLSTGTPVHARRRSRSKILLLGGGIASCVALVAVVALVGLLAGGVLRIRTQEGTIVLENLPPDADVAVDGERVTIDPGDGKPYEIRVAPGKKHRLQVKRDGFKIFGTELAIDAGARRTIEVHLEPRLAAGNPPAPAPALAPPDKAPPPLPRPVAEDKGFVPLFNGKDLTGWILDGGPKDAWAIVDGSISCRGKGSAARGWLLTEKSYADFVFRCQFQLDQEADSGIGIRAQPGETIGKLPIHLNIKLRRRPVGSVQTGSLYYWLNTAEPPARPAKLKPPGAWNDLEIEVRGQTLRVAVNDAEVQDLDLSRYASLEKVLGGAKRKAGRIGLAQHSGEARFRAIRIKDLTRDIAPPAKTDSGFVPLFNGKDLTGWKTHPQAPGNWRVEAGVLVGRGPKKNCLFTDRGDYEDLHFLIEAMINQGGNSGQQFRMPFGPDAGLKGYEVQIDSSKHGAKTGSLFVDKGTPEILIKEALVPVDVRFTQEVIGAGTTLLFF